MLAVGAVLLAGVAAALTANRLGVPVLLAFLAIGMLLGSDGPGGIEFNDAHLTRTVGVVALAIILFEGGLTTPWRAIRPVVVTASSLATFGVLVTSGITALVAYLVFDNLSVQAALLIGSVVASTDAAAVFATLRFTTLRHRLARVLEAESGVNDPMAVALTIGFVEWLKHDDFGALDLGLLVAEQLAIGLAVGLAVGVLAAAALRRLPSSIAPFAPVASLATAAVGYGLADVVHGSGFLAVYIVGLWIGNTATPLRRSLVAFHEGTAFLAQIALFVVLGLFVFPSQLDSVVLPGLAVAFALVFVARPVAVWLSTLFQGFEGREVAFLGWAGLRGAVPIVLASFAAAEGVAESGTIFHAVFFVVIVSTLLQGPTLEPLAQRLELTTRAVTEYRPPLEVTAVDSLGGDLLEHAVLETSPIAGKHIRDLDLPRDSLVAVIMRGEEAIPPRGSMRIEPGDRLYVVSRAEARGEVLRLFERWAAASEY
jgi:cell volume regulation protein A